MEIDPAKKLRKKIAELPGGFAEAAEKLGCTREWLYTLCSKKKRSEKERRLPGLDFASRVQELYGIPASSWSHAAKRAA